MTQRHVVDTARIETVLVRLEELVRANSGDDPFEEVFKILLVKLYAEQKKINFLPDSTKAFLNNFNCILQKVNKEWVGLLLPNEYQTKLSEDHLKICLDVLSDINLYDNNLESLDMFFEYLVSKNSKGEKGQFFTPRHVIDCCVKIINPNQNEFILDPACGSGGFLFHCLSHFPVDDKYKINNIWGFDFDPRAIRVAKTLVTISGGNAKNLFNINSLLKPSVNLKNNYTEWFITAEDILRTREKKFSGFDVILTNPPFAGEIKEESLINSYEITKLGHRNERDILFIERCIELLKPGGKLAIVLPHNKIGGKGFSYLRKWMFKHVRIVAVLSLPRTTFLPHTHQKTEVVFAIKREKPITHYVNEEILFLISEKNSKDTKGNYIYKSSYDMKQSNWDKVDHDLKEVVELFNSFISKQDLRW